MAIELNTKKIGNIASGAGKLIGNLLLLGIPCAAVWGVGSCAYNGIQDMNKSADERSKSEEIYTQMSARSKSDFEGSELRITSDNVVELREENNSSLSYNFQQRILTVGSNGAPDKAGTSFRFSDMDRPELPERVRQSACQLAISFKAQYPTMPALPELYDGYKTEAQQIHSGTLNFAQRYCRS